MWHPHMIIMLLVKSLWWEKYILSATKDPADRSTITATNTLVCVLAWLNLPLDNMKLIKIYQQDPFCDSLYQHNYNGLLFTLE